MRNRFQPVGLAGDLKQAFLQVRIREEDRDVMRFHWLKDLETKHVAKHVRFVLVAILTWGCDRSAPKKSRTSTQGK